MDALSARDILGIHPSVAIGWDDGALEHAAAAIEGAAAAGEVSDSAPLGYAADPATAVLASVTEIDFRRSRSGRDAIIYARAAIVERDYRRVDVEAAKPGGDDPRHDNAFEIVGSGWNGDLAELLDRDPARLRAIAVAAGHPIDTSLVVHPAAQEPFAALYIAGENRMLVNPVYLLTLEPQPDDDDRRAARAPSSTAVSAAAGRRALADGNPYSFFGSLDECGADQRLRCEGCSPAGTCESVTRDSDDGNAECEAFAADNGRGYFLFCANLAAAIATVADCIADTAPACAANTDAGNLLSALEANAALIDDPLCLEATDGCLASIYGDPDGDFGGIPDPADPPPPPPPPPRKVEFGCGDNDVDCDFAPQLGCSSEGCASGPSCGGCDGGCEGGGCDSSCDGGSGCDSDCDSGSCEGGSCEGCNSDGSGCQSGSCESCNSNESGSCDSSCEGGNCDNGCQSGSCSGGDCSGGDCSGGDCGGSGGDCGGGGGGSQCSTAGKRRAAPWGAPVLSALFPLLIIGRLRRRERRRQALRGGRR